MEFKIIRTCIICGKKFDRISKQVGFLDKCCSWECAKKMLKMNNREIVRRVCKNCGKGFWRELCNRDRFCSKKCHFQYYKKTGKPIFYIEEFNLRRQTL